MSARRQQARLGEMEGAGRGDSDSHMIAAGSEASGGDSSSSSSRGGKAALATAPPENWSVVYVDISGLSGRCDTTRQDKTRQRLLFRLFPCVFVPSLSWPRFNHRVSDENSNRPARSFPFSYFPFSSPSSVNRFAGRRCSTRWRWCSSSAAASSRACAPSSSRAAAFGTCMWGSQEETKDSSVQSVCVFVWFRLTYTRFANTVVVLIFFV
jgi:hypothetical protein